MKTCLTRNQEDKAEQVKWKLRLSESDDAWVHWKYTVQIYFSVILMDETSEDNLSIGTPTLVLHDSGRGKVDRGEGLRRSAGRVLDCQS